MLRAYEVNNICNGRTKAKIAEPYLAIHLQRLLKAKIKVLITFIFFELNR